MSDSPREERFGSTQALVKEIQERSDDIEKAVLIPPGYVLTYRHQPQSSPLDRWGLMLYFTTDRKMIFGEDVEAVLNDGILNRMKIRIELAKRSV
jgi:hypothetical protein